MNNIVVFSEQSLYQYIINCSLFDYKKNDEKIDGLIKVNVDNVSFLFTHNKKDKDISKQTLIVFKDLDSIMDNYNVDEIGNLLQRIHKYSHNIHRKKNSIPYNWGLSYKDNKVMFKAFDSEKNLIKAVIEIKGSKDQSTCNNIFIHGLVKTQSKDILSLYDYNSKEYINATDKLSEAIKSYLDKIESHEIEQMEGNLLLTNSIFSEDNLFTYNEWMSKLSKVQKKFVESKSPYAIKLRGPAGTGKTLAMQMKVLKLLKDNPEKKILYLTHSWAVAEKVQDFIDITIEDLDSIDRVDVFPLISFAEVFNDKNKKVVMLGDDSFSGKMLQLEIIENIVAEYTRKNLPLLKKILSPELKTRLTDPNVKMLKLLYWDLMLEFACVIGANGIMPGITAKEKYKNIERRPWMMQLESDKDKDFIISMYTEYINYLVSKSEITSDQVINDFLNQLSTYNWYYERVEKGYDYIFVDEMQLFNEQERMVFHFLTKSPDEYPTLFIALDPKQAVMETFFDDISSHHINIDEKSSENTFGKSENITLGEIFRYTPEILSFLKHIDKSYPALGLGQDWNNNIKKSTSKKNKGTKPSIKIFDCIEKEINEAIKIAAKSSSNGCKTAILVMDNDNFQLIRSKNKNPNTEFIESKEDTLKLKYKKRALVVSQPCYVIGLQFDTIIMVGCNIFFNEHDSNKSYYLRRYISDLYLGCSRASSKLILTASSTIGFIPTFLNSALDKQLLENLNI